jgi:glycosyltransferase involved in cell wall biosynthesis
MSCQRNFAEGRLMGRKISVIMPVYNGEQFLEESLESYFSQTIASECELIFVDDGSTDATREILDACTERFNGYVRVFSQTNQGSGKARNLGIEAAVGEYIAFLDADDLYPNEQTLEALYRAAKEHEAQIAGGSLIMFDSTSEYCDYAATVGFEGHTFSESKMMDYVDYQFDYGYLRFIYERALLRDWGIVFPDYLRYQDPPFFVRAMLAAGRFFALEEPSYKYRVSAKAVSWDTRRALDMIRGITEVAVLAAENNLETLLSYDLMRLNVDNRRVFFQLILEEGNLEVLAALFAAKNTVVQTKSRLDLESLLKATPSILDDLQLALTQARTYRQAIELSNSLTEELAHKTDEYRQLQAYNETILSSTAWKVGRNVTWLPRTLKKQLQGEAPPSGPLDEEEAAFLP